MLREIDPVQHHAMEQLQEACHRKYPHTQAIGAIDPILYEGRAIMFNRQTPKHVDRLDPLRSWAALLVLGAFQGGTMYIERLQLRLRYLPGDMIFIRGAILPHEVEAFSGGQRISIAHFTHQSLWKEFNMEIP